MSVIIGKWDSCLAWSKAPEASRAAAFSRFWQDRAVAKQLKNDTVDKVMTSVTL